MEIFKTICAAVLLFIVFGFLLMTPLGQYVIAMFGGSCQYGHL